jgi:spore germination protein
VKPPQTVCSTSFVACGRHLLPLGLPDHGKAWEGFWEDFKDINDENIIKLAKEYGVAPIMFVSAMTEQGRGNYSATHAIFNNLEAQNKLIDNVLIKMKEKGYVGVNLAFYSILYQDLPLYVSFVESITERLNSEGYEVFVTMTPHTFSYQPGVAYEKSYYADIGKVANYIILISYLWSQAYISEVAQTTVGYLKSYLDFVITQTNPEKIFIGLERIAYDWELPYIEGETMGTSLTNMGAINLANQLGSNIEFDEATQTPYFNYNSSGIEHFVWFKDARSENAILNLVDTYGLAGIAVWNILYYSSQTWLSIIHSTI